MKSQSLMVCVVDDDPAYQQMVLEYLTLLGYQSKGFHSGEEFLKQFNRSADVVVVDHNLGEGMNGSDVLRAIKGERQEVPVIYISAADKVTVVADAYRNGSDDYIGKDSASLIRLKLRLEKIQKLKILKLKKKRRRMQLLSAITGVAMLLTFLLLRLFFA